MQERHTCADCGLTAPETESSYTLISAQHGWRLTRNSSPDGKFVMQWRCPACWRAYRAKLGEPPSSRDPKRVAPSTRPKANDDDASSVFERVTRRLRGHKSKPP